MICIAAKTDKVGGRDELDERMPGQRSAAADDLQARGVQQHANQCGLSVHTSCMQGTAPCSSSCYLSCPASRLSGRPSHAAASLVRAPQGGGGGGVCVWGGGGGGPSPCRPHPPPCDRRHSPPHLHTPAPQTGGWPRRRPRCCCCCWPRPLRRRPLQWPRRRHRRAAAPVRGPAEREAEGEGRQVWVAGGLSPPAHMRAGERQSCNGSRNGTTNVDIMYPRSLGGAAMAAVTRAFPPTLYPRSSSLRTRTRPTRPVAPVTSTVVSGASGDSNSGTSASWLQHEQKRRRGNQREAAGGPRGRRAACAPTPPSSNTSRRLPNARELVHQLGAARGVADALQLRPHVVKHLAGLAAHCGTAGVRGQRVLVEAGGSGGGSQHPTTQRRALASERCLRGRLMARGMLGGAADPPGPASLDTGFRSSS